MKTQLTKSLADHIIAQNQKLKLQVIHLHKNLQLFQSKMIQALDQLIQTLSKKTQSYQQILLFQNPYQCLTAFVQIVTKSTSFSLDTSHQNQQLTKQNHQLKIKLKKLQDQTVSRLRAQQQIVQQLNLQIQNKKSKLKDLQDDYNNLLKTKKSAEKQLNQTKQQMKILRLKLYEEQRQKLTEIIVANKKQMIEFRKSMEMQSYKLQLNFKKQIAQKDKQIKSLIKNVEELINSNLNATSDLTVLQKIVKPIRQSTQQKQQIIALRKELFAIKNQLRQKQSKILGLEGANADITLSRDNLKSRNERVQIEKNLLIEELQEKTQELQTAIKDRKALDLYYSQKWHSQFSKVRQNLQEKYNAKLKALEKEFEQKKREIQAQIEIYVQRLRLTKNQLNAANTRIAQLTQENHLLNNQILKLTFSFNQRTNQLRESDMLHNEDLKGYKLRWSEMQQSLKQQIRKWQYSSNKFQSTLNQTINDFNLQRSQLLESHWNQIETLKKQHRLFINQLQTQHKDQLANLQKYFSNAKQAIQAGRLEEMLKFQQKQKQLHLKQQQELKEYDKLNEAKLLKINQKFNAESIKYQKLKKQRDQEIHQYNLKLGQAQKLLHQGDLQLIAKDVELDEYKKMKQKYLAQITSLNLKLNEETFQKRSLQVELNSTQTKLKEREDTIKLLQSKKHIFREEISRLQAQYKQQFSQLQRIHKKALFHSKFRITQLQRLFQKRPIKKQHYIQIQDLQKKNHQLKTQIQLKEAENLIIAQVKEYYEQKAQENLFPKHAGNSLNTNNISNSNNNAFINPQDDPTKGFISTKNLLRSTNSQIIRETVKTNQKPVFVKKYSNRRNKLIASAIKLDYFEQSDKQPETKEVAQMKRYLSKQQKINQTSTAFKTRTHPDRSKSSMT